MAAGICWQLGLGISDLQMTTFDRLTWLEAFLEGRNRRTIADGNSTAMQINDIKMNYTLPACG
jgi:hypothetical protein